MNRDSNAYTFLFAAIMVLVVAAALSFAAVSLQPMQNENIRKEKMQNILHTIGVETERDQAGEEFEKYITEQVALTSTGDVDPNVNAFEIDLTKEIKKPIEEQRFPLFIADVNGEHYYIIPLRGAGLWDAIWGYISLKNDVNTVKGAIFDHKGETPGLGAEITQSWFQQRFEDEKIFDQSGNFVGVTVQKGYSGGNNKDDNAVDAISGATITGDGVTKMIHDRIQYYLPYLEKQNVNVALNK
ncbi:NADH:ubiquinone reductase (Na(+)-transporting) subunit C [Robertkochia solimangrovi]|uniref:NADH:ubiquinone reductase (Na(+)-transporting) subunit C n=1 Tax=Robertkochia solimangrovi TaxID=2213046 RepID=UPI00117DE8DB|nr:NADH:ubiquinone reductase (Na(+)-transporting) subunit C [Robertkochia solimangrovi]TRZ41398.1 NADH:ubiquinone reductase (Na(+)-transporting) subunit C [Robertkochia solimangrovi]